MAPKPAQHGFPNVDLAGLVEMEAADLRRLWQERRGVAPPSTLSGRLMRLVLAWDIQAEEKGSESPAAWRQWQAVMARRTGGADADDAVSGLSAPSVIASTRLLRSWGGETHEVIVTALEWADKKSSGRSDTSNAEALSAIVHHAELRDGLIGLRVNLAPLVDHPNVSEVLTASIEVPITLQRSGRNRPIVLRAETGLLQRDPDLIALVSDARRWMQDLVDGRAGSVAEITAR